MAAAVFSGDTVGVYRSQRRIDADANAYTNPDTNADASSADTDADTRSRTGILAVVWHRIARGGHGPKTTMEE